VTVHSTVKSESRGEFSDRGDLIGETPHTDPAGQFLVAMTH